MRASRWIASIGLALALQAGAQSAVSTEDARSALIGRIESFKKQKNAGDAEGAAKAGGPLLVDLRATLGVDDPETLDHTYRLAEVKRDLGEYVEALALARDAAQRLARVEGERHPQTLRARVVAGTIQDELGRWRDAIAEYEDVVRLALDDAAGRTMQRYANGELVLSYTRIGLLGRAAALGERLLQDDLEANRQATPVGFTNMENLAGVYLDLGRIDEGLELQRRATALFARTFGDDDYRTVASLSNVAQALRRAQRLDEAIAVSRQVVAAEERQQSGLGARNTLLGRNTIATLLIESGQLDEAERELDAVRPRWHQAFGPGDPQAIDVDYYAARIAIARGQLSEARTALSSVCDAYVQAGDTQSGETRMCPIRLADVEWRLGERGVARERLARSVEVLEQRASDGLLSDLSQQGLNASNAPHFRRLMEWHVALGETARAFEASERLRGRSLLQSIVLRHADDSAAVLPAEESARLAEIKGRIARLDEQAAHETDVERRLAIRGARDERYRELAAARNELRQRYPRYGALAQPIPVDLDQAATLLDRGSAAIVYAFGETRLFAFVLTRTRPPVIADLGERASIEAKANAWRALLAQDDAVVWRSATGEWRVGGMPPGPGWRRERDWRPLARDLGRTLLGPLAAVRERDWIVVPDGVLAQLPFEALDLRGRVAIATRTIRYVQSMSVLAALARRATRAPASAVLSMGDPDYGTAVAPARVAAQFDAATFTRGMAADSSVARRAYDRLGLVWAPLPGTRREVDAVAAAFKADAVTALTGREAAESTLQSLNARGALRALRVLHFATHGYLNIDVPALSAIVLSQVDTTPQADGYVTAAEWPAYDLDSDLIVLSGCETGRGRTLDGEGVMGLPYALFVAGNRNAVLTLWKVADDSSGRFVAAFMRRVAAGLPVAQALARTKREFAHQPRLDWAAFVHYGR